MNASELENLWANIKRYNMELLRKLEEFKEIKSWCKKCEKLAVLLDGLLSVLEKIHGEKVTVV